MEIAEHEEEFILREVASSLLQRYLVRELEDTLLSYDALFERLNSIESEPDS